MILYAVTHHRQIIDYVSADSVDKARAIYRLAYPRKADEVALTPVKDVEKTPPFPWP